MAGYKFEIEWFYLNKSIGNTKKISESYKKLSVKNKIKG